jgi:hypothetical protein
MKKHLAINISRHGASFVSLRDSSIHQEQFNNVDIQSVKNVQKTNILRAMKGISTEELLEKMRHPNWKW